MSDETLRALVAVFDDEWEGTFAKDVAHAIDAHVRAVVAEMKCDKAHVTCLQCKEELRMPLTEHECGGTVTITHARWEALLAERDELRAKLADMHEDYEASQDARAQNAADRAAAIARAEAAEAQRDGLADVLRRVATVGMSGLSEDGCMWCWDDEATEPGRYDPVHGPAHRPHCPIGLALARLSPKPGG